MPENAGGQSRAVRKHVVVLIHGIRTQGEWQQRAAATLEAEPTILVRPTRYEFLDVVRFLLPFARLRRRPVQRITRLLRDELTKRPDHLSVIAHSFGTFIVGRILQDEPDIEFHRLILCGSIVPDAFPWENFRHRLSAHDSVEWQVVNDCGLSDPWPVFAQSVTWGYGSSGRFGFGHGRVKDRFHPVGHSGFFSEHFVRTYWLPYLTTGDVVEGQLDRPTTPWWFSVLTVLRLRYAAVIVLALSFVAGATVLVPLLSRLVVPSETETGPPTPGSRAAGATAPNEKLQAVAAAEIEQGWRALAYPFTLMLWQIHGRSVGYDVAELGRLLAPDVFAQIVAFDIRGEAPHYSGSWRKILGESSRNGKQALEGAGSRFNAFLDADLIVATQGVLACHYLDVLTITETSMAQIDAFPGWNGKPYPLGNLSNEKELDKYLRALVTLQMELDKHLPKETPSPP